MDKKGGFAKFSEILWTLHFTALISANTLNLNLSPSAMDEKFEEIDKDKNGKLSMKEFIDYFLETTQENEKKFKEEYGNFGMQPPGVGDSNFENAILLCETMSKVKLDLR